MTFEEYSKLKVGMIHGCASGMIFKLAEEYAKMKAEQSARRALEYLLKEYNPWSNNMTEMVNKSIQHAISEG
jgi:TolA-binding protein